MRAARQGDNGDLASPLKTHMHRCMRILFITSTRLGDAVISTGLLDHLLHRYPQARFTIACGPVAAGLFAHMPRRERTIIMTKRPYDMHWVDLWRQCMGTRWDLCVDLRGSVIPFLLRVGNRRGMRGGRRPGPRVAHLAQVLGLSPPPVPVVWTSAAERDRARALLPGGEGPWVALAPTANWAGKVWPAERFVAFWHEFVAAHGPARPVILYGPGDTERRMAQGVISALGNALDTGGGLSVTQVAAVLQRCMLFVGNDSGLMHLSAAAGTPTLGLFGPSRVDEYAPCGRAVAHVVAPGPAGQADMRDLGVANVVDAALNLLADSREAG